MCFPKETITPASHKAASGPGEATSLLLLLIQVSALSKDTRPIPPLRQHPSSEDPGMHGQLPHVKEVAVGPDPYQDCSMLAGKSGLQPVWPHSVPSNGPHFLYALGLALAAGVMEPLQETMLLCAHCEDSQST